MARRSLLVIAALLLLGFGLALSLPLGDGQPLLRWQDLRQLPEDGINPIWRRLSVHTGAGNGMVTSYRWRGDNGEWQLSNTPPPAGIPYETLEVDPDANLLPAPVHH